MTPKYDSLELAILNLMRTDAAYRIANQFNDGTEDKAVEVTPDNFYDLINAVVPCQPLELTLTAKMLAREGLLDVTFANITGEETGYRITKEGLVALRGTK